MTDGSSDAPRRPSAADPWLVLVLGLGFLLRALCWWSLRGAPFVAELVMDSREYDRWAMRIAGGDWLGSGAFFQAPLYPYLMAVVYRVAGHRLDAIYLLQILVAVAACAALFAAGRRTGGRALGLAAAALMAAYGPFLFYDVQVLKESLATSCVCFLLAALVRARESAAIAAWIGAGALLGVLALLRENALLVAPFLLPLAWRRDEAAGAGARAALGHAAPRALALVAGLALVLAPVALRNAWVGGGLLPTTFQGGVNFYIGNHAGADGTYQPLVAGEQTPELERAAAVRLAEQSAGHPLRPAQVSSFWLHRALAWAAARPLDFLRLQARKLAMFWSWYEWPDAVDYYDLRERSWVLRLPLLELGGVEVLALAGLWLERRRLGRFAPALLLTLGWMVSTVLFFLFSRYRLPVLPALLLLAAVPLAALARAARRRDWRRAAPLAALLLVAVAAPRLAGFAPRRDLVEINLGRLAEERQDVGAAERHFRNVLTVAPDDFSALTALGKLTARGGDLADALPFFLRAASVQPGSADAQSNLGGVLLATGDAAGARDHLERALALDPTHWQALQNLAVLRLRSGDVAGARELVERLLVADPANAGALRLRARIERLAAP